MNDKIYVKDKLEFERFYRTLSGFVFHRISDTGELPTTLKGRGFG